MMTRMIKRTIVLLMVALLVACAEPTDTTETQTDGELSVTLLDVRIGEETLFGELPEGEIWLLVDVAIENVGSVSRTINALLMFRLEDDENVYDLDIFADGAGALDGTLNAGARKEGTLTFAVQAAGEGYQLIFTPRVNQPGRLTFDLDSYMP